MRLPGARTRTLLLLGIFVLVAGCGQESPGPSAGHEPSVLPPPTATPSPSEYVAPITTMGADGLQEAGPQAMSMPAFERAMAAYCTDYYTSQREAEEKYLGSDQQTRIDFARANAANAHRTERQLDQLAPPAKLATAFGQFVDNARQISEDRQSMLRSTQATGEDGQAGDDLDEAVNERWELATQLHAPMCDGKLPAAQAAAAVAVAREWATSTDPVAACRDLVSPWILEDQATCVHIRTLENTPPYALPDDIDVVSVAGVEELTATVDYLKVGGCACAPDGYVRLFFVDGAWLVNQSQE
jgi:hypothetical protein